MFSNEEKRGPNMRIKIHIDGACEPRNPGGNMGIGVCILIEGEVLAEHSQSFPAHVDNSSNVAEYMALEWALSYLILEGVKGTHVMIYSDSQLLVNQMGGSWRIKQGRYLQKALLCREHLEALEAVYNTMQFVWVPREQNERADWLSKKTLIHGIQNPATK